MPLPFVQPDETKRSYYSGSTGLVNQLHVGTIVHDPVEYATYALARFKEVAADVPIANDPTVRSVSFDTHKFWPPYRVTVRTSANWHADVEGKFENRIWVFELPGAEHVKDFEMKFMLNGVWMEGGNLLIREGQPHRHFTEAEVFFPYKFIFRTEKWQPNHLVTLRNSDDGWGRDIYGVYRGGEWIFLLDQAKYPGNFEAKFVLDRHLFMSGENLPVTPDTWLYIGQDPIPDDTDQTEGDGKPRIIHFPAVPTAYPHGYDNFLSIESPLEQVTVRTIGSEAENYDVIVIGSGMGGGVLADALSERGARTLILDAGGLGLPVHMCELPRSEIDLPGRDELGHFKNETGSNLHNGVHFNLGGRSVYWSGLIPRMSRWEMRDAWPEAVRRYLTEPEDGLSGYDRAEKLMRKGKTLGPFQDRVREHLEKALGTEFKVIDLPRSLHQPNMDEDGDLQNVLEKPTGVFSTTDLLLDSLGHRGRSGRANLRINLHQLATQIVKSDQKATAVVCQDLTGNIKRERRYHGKYIVLACGSLESAKLALNSELDDPADDNEKMGFGLTDHPTYFYQRHHDLPNTGPLAWVGDSRGHAKILIQHKAATPTDHAYNIELLINPKYWDTRHADDELWEDLNEEQKMSKVELQFKFDSDLKLNNYIRPTGEGKKPDVFVAPNPPTSAFNDEIVKYRNKILTALGVTEFTNHWIPEEWGDGKDGTVHHAGGTLRMSADGTGVVDENLKFRKYDNLYCCDLSVYPTIPAANPSLTLVALALRLAETLGDRLGLSPAKGSSHLV